MIRAIQHAKILFPVRGDPLQVRLRLPPLPEVNAQGEAFENRSFDLSLVRGTAFFAELQAVQSGGLFKPAGFLIQVFI